MARPGNVDSHHAVDRFVAPAARSLPQSGCGNNTPRPRKLSVVAVSTAQPIALLPSTTTSVTRLGSRWRSDVRSRVDPNTYAAWTNSAERSVRTEPSTIRANPGVNAMPMASTMLRTPEPAVAMSISAISSTGSASSTSTTRMTTALSQHGAEQAREQHRMGAVDRAAEDVPAELVGAEQVPSARRGQNVVTGSHRI